MKSIVCIGILFVTSFGFSQDRSNEGDTLIFSSSDSSEMVSYSNLRILDDLGFSSPIDFGKKIDLAIVHFDVTELAGLSTNLHFMEEASGKKSEHITAKELVQLAIDIMLMRATPDSLELDLLITIAELVNNEPGLSALRNYSAEMQSSGFGETIKQDASLIIMNHRETDISVYLNGMMAKPHKISNKGAQEYSLSSGLNFISIIAGKKMLRKKIYVNKGRPNRLEVD
jgi:hypothetical protein